MLPIILTGVIAFVVALVIGIPAGILYRKKVAEKEIISAEEKPSASSTKPSRALKAKSGKPW